MSISRKYISSTNSFNQVIQQYTWDYKYGLNTASTVFLGAREDLIKFKKDHFQDADQLFALHHYYPEYYKRKWTPGGNMAFVAGIMVKALENKKEIIIITHLAELLANAKKSYAEGLRFYNKTADTIHFNKIFKQKNFGFTCMEIVWLHMNEFKFILNFKNECLTKAIPSNKIANIYLPPLQLLTFGDANYQIHILDQIVKEHDLRRKERENKLQQAIAKEQAITIADQHTMSQIFSDEMVDSSEKMLIVEDAAPASQSVCESSSDKLALNETVYLMDKDDVGKGESKQFIVEDDSLSEMVEEESVTQKTDAFNAKAKEFIPNQSFDFNLFSKKIKREEKMNFIPEPVFQLSK